MLSRRALFRSLAAAFLPLPASENAVLVPPNENVSASLVTIGDYDLEIRALFGSGADVTYFFVTILPKTQRKVVSQRSIANELFAAGLLPLRDSNATNFNAAQGQQPIKTIEIEHGGFLYRLTGDLWLLVDNHLVIGPAACAALTEALPGEKISITLAKGTWAQLKIS